MVSAAVSRTVSTIGDCPSPPLPRPAAAALANARLPEIPNGGDEALWQEQHEEDKDQPHDDAVVDQRLLAEQEFEIGKPGRAKDRPKPRAKPADDAPDDNLRRLT